MNKKEFIDILKNMRFQDWTKEGLSCYVFCEVKNNILTLRSRDWKEAIETSFPYEHSDCSFTVEREDFHKIEKLSEGNISVEVVGEKCYLIDSKDNKIELEQSPSSKMGDFENPFIEEYRLVCKLDTEISSNIISCNKTNNKKDELNYIYCNDKQKEIVATDASCLVIQKLEDIEILDEFYFPKKFLRKDTVISRVWQSKDHYQFKIGTYYFYLRKVTFRFPDYSRVVPAYRSSGLVRLNGLELKELAKKCKGTIDLRFKDNKLFVFGDNILQGEMTVGAYAKEPHQVSVNSAFLANGITENEITLSTIASNFPVMITGNKTKVIVMPVVTEIKTEANFVNIEEFTYKVNKKVTTKKATTIAELEALVREQTARIDTLEMLLRGYR